MLTRINETLLIDLEKVVAIQGGKVMLTSGHSIQVDADLMALVNRAHQARLLRELVGHGLNATVTHHIARGPVDLAAMVKQILKELDNEN